MDDPALIEQLDKLFTSGSVSWLFGAGISRFAGVPLMLPLTERVLKNADGKPHRQLLQVVRDELPDGHHVEHILSSLADHIAVARASKSKRSTIGSESFELADLEAAHGELVKGVADVVRWGIDDAGAVGSATAPIINIAEHQAFIDALFRTTHAGISERRSPVKIFTTNYDTLLEDALALGGVPYWDGFSGGAVGFRSHRFGQGVPTDVRAHLVKLHGSIDWHVDDDSRVWRVREGDLYPSTARRVLIYPQAAKYAATQRDPFAAQFDIFRQHICHAGHVLVTCGYSFGDEHINDEIDASMMRADADCVLIALVSEQNGLPEVIGKWRSARWARHLYVLSERGVYVGSDGPFLRPSSGGQDWWTFAALARLLKDGLKEQMK